MRRCRLLLATGAALSLSLASLAGAARASSCDEAAARARLAQLQQALERPESLAAIDAAKADYAADQRFDNTHDAKILAAAAVYIKIERHLDAGAVGDTCRFLGQADALIDAVVAGK